MKIETSVDRILLSGTLYLQDLEVLVAKLTQQIHSENKVIYISLSEIEDMDTAALQVFVAARTMAHNLQKQIKITALNTIARQAFTLSGLDALFPLPL